MAKKKISVGAKIRIQAIQEEVEQIKSIKQSVDRNNQMHAVLMQNSLGKAFAMVNALNKVLRIFGGASINLGGINIEQLLLGLFRLEEANKEYDDLVEDNFIQELADMDAQILVKDEKFTALFTEVTGFYEGISSDDVFYDEAAFTRAISEYIVDIHAADDFAASVNSALSQISAYLTILASFNQSIVDAMQDVFDFVDKILGKIVEAVDAIQTIIQALGVAARLADVSPFNVLPGSLGWMQGFLALLMSALSNLSRSIGDFSSGIYDFTRLSNEITVLLKTRMYDESIAAYT